MSLRDIRSGALLGALAIAVAAAGASIVDGGREARAGERDSPWPDTERIDPNVRAVRAVVEDLEAKVQLMSLSVDRYADWRACLRGIPVSEYGDPDGRFGFLYDERDGTGRGHMPALAIDRRSRRGREDYLFLNLSRGDDCRSLPTLPGGTADPASTGSPARAAGIETSLPSTVRDLERRVKVLKRKARRLLASSEIFDEWESCVSWVPVTELGDPGGRYGYLFGGRAGTQPRYRSALVIDRSDWDDPDYMFLAFVGGDRPGRTCQDEPGEAID